MSPFADAHRSPLEGRPQTAGRVLPHRKFRSNLQLLPTSDLRALVVGFTGGCGFIVSVLLFDRKSDAERHDANVHADLSRGQYVDDRAGRITVVDLAERWRSAQLHVDSTVVLVEKAVRLHIAGTTLGRQQVKDVRSSHIQAWVKDRSAVLAPTTLRVVCSYLCSMFGAAVRDRIIGKTPCDGIKLPDVDRHGRFIPSAEQIHQLAALLSVRFAPMIYVASGCGLRIGEALGLESTTSILRGASCMCVDS